MKRLLAALLPSESREHILGDLAERGNRPRDVLSVLPRVWWSHFRRSLHGPLPPIRTAEDVLFESRYWQLRAASVRYVLYQFAVFAVLNAAASHKPSMLLMFLVLLPLNIVVPRRVSSVHRSPKPYIIGVGPEPQDSWRQIYLRALSLERSWLTTGVWTSFVVATALPRVVLHYAPQLGPIWSIPLWIIAALLASYLAHRLRDRGLKRQLEAAA